MSQLEDVVGQLRHKLGSSRYLQDVLWQVSGNGASQILGILAMPVLTRLYAPSDFAVLNLFLQAVAGMAVLMTLRYEYLVVLPVDPLEADAVTRKVIYLGAAHVVFWTPILSGLASQWPWIQEKGEVIQWLWFVPVTAWGLSLSVAWQQRVQRKGNFRDTGLAEFMGRTAYVLSAFVGSLALPNLLGLVATTFASVSTKLGWLWWCDRMHPAHEKPTQAAVPVSKELRRMATSTSISNVFSFVSSAVPMAFIAEKYGATELGLYGLVLSTLYLPSSVVGQGIGQVYFQRACKIRGDSLLFVQILATTSRNLLGISAPLFTVIALIAPIAYPFAFGEAWRACGDIASWMCLAAAVGLLSTPLDRTSIVVGAWWYLTAWHGMRAASTLTLLFVASNLSTSFPDFIAALSVLTACFYAFDWCASYWMAKHPIGVHGAMVHPKHRRER